MSTLVAIISAISKLGASKAWDKAKRQEAVIRLLRQFKLDPENPPTDFDSIYAYTLIEYGIDVPKTILNFFRNNFVKEAFRQSFLQNNPSILDKEAQDIIEWNEETGKLGRIDYDPRREFAMFSIVFHSIIDRTRTLAEVRRDHKLEHIDNTLDNTTREIITSLKKLTTLSQIRTERDQIIQASPYNPLSTLAQQMRDWFKVLSYNFESYEKCNDNYFEWIINVPARRGYDRILIRGIDGVAEVSDVNALRENLDKQKTTEGWLVAMRRVSQAAREVLKKQENCNLFCYTFDELLDEKADFSGYLSWLESEVKRRGIDKMYVPLACKKEDFDPVTKQKIAEDRYDASNGWTEGYIDRWLADPSKEHISLLGEFGTGKTWLTLHYAWIALQRYQDAKAQGVERPRLPLIIPLRDYAKAVSVESLFSEFFFRKHEIPLPNYSAFEQLNRMGKLLLIFDGFDEMADRVDRQKMINNFWELARVVVPGSKVILTCRTEHFPEAKEGRALLNAELQASTTNLTGEPPQFEVLELEYFDNEQIRKVLSFRTKPNIIKKIMDNEELLALAHRPLMIELILEALPDIEAGKPIDLSRVYLYAVRQKMDRDIKDERTFTSLSDKLYFMCELSWEMLSTNQMTLNYRYFPNQIRRMFGPTVQEQIDLDHWHYDMMGQTMLVRNSDGDYSPAHRSLLEFFIAYKFTAELGLLESDFVELAQIQSYLEKTTSSQDYTWSNYYNRIMDKKNAIQLKTPLRSFEQETINNLVETVGKQELTPVVQELMMSMIISDKQKAIRFLIAIVEQTRGKTFDEVKYVGGNCISLINKLDTSFLQGKNLSGVCISHANLAYANLSGCIFDAANLSHVSFQGANLMNASIKNCNLLNIYSNYSGLLEPLPIGSRRSRVAT